MSIVKIVAHPLVEDFDLAKVLHALSDPVRLKLVRMLAAEGDVTCGDLCLGRPKSSMSHHFKTMIDAGLLRVRVAGNIHLNSLRLDDLERRFPGLMTAVLSADVKVSAGESRHKRCLKPSGIDRGEPQMKQKRFRKGALV